MVRLHTGHLVEALMSKVAAQLGKEGDATPFIDLSYQKISDMLHQCGYQQRGWETMYNGHTGRQLKVRSWSTGHPPMHPVVRQACCVHFSAFPGGMSLFHGRKT